MGWEIIRQPLDARRRAPSHIRGNYALLGMAPEQQYIAHAPEGLAALYGIAAIRRMGTFSAGGALIQRYNVPRPMRQSRSGRR